jgi:Ca-activated chloride channel family protein
MARLAPDAARKDAARMSVQVTTPAVLVLLLLVPMFFVRRGRGDASRAGVVAAALRAGAAAAVIALLAGVHLERPRPEAGTCLVAAIDVSASVQGAATARAEEVLAALVPGLGPHDELGSVAFAARARVVAHPRRTPDVASLLPPPASDLTGFESGDTDLGAALTTASALCPAGKERALLFFTDGNETQGSFRAEAARLAAGVPVHVFVPSPAALPPAVIRRVLAPTYAPEHTVLPLELVVDSRATEPLTADLQLTANGDPLAREHTRLAPGMNVIALPYRLRGAGQYALEAELSLPTAPGPLPGRGRATVAVTRPMHVLVASERATPVVATALAERGMHVEMVDPAGLARRLGTLASYHLVILDDVARAGLSDATLEALAEWVARGGGLIATGGEHFFGDAAFAGTALERVLPVTLRAHNPTPQEREPIALYLVIDRSNSMGYASRQPGLHNGEKMAYAKRAALAVLDQLGDRDLVATIAFDSQPYELGPLQPAGEIRGALAAKIQQIQYGGGTDFKESLEIARRNLIESGRSVRHVILLTDGDSNRSAEDHAAVIAALAAADVTVTSIRVGSDTVNLDLLDAISRATGGSFHHVADVRQLPQLMIRDAQRLMGRATARREMTPRIADGGAILAGIAADELPSVARWATVEKKRDAETRLYVEDGEARDPLLVTWQYELGRVAVVPLDFQGGAAAWPGWRGFGKLWTQLAEWAAPRGLPSDHHLAATRRPDGTRIVLDTVDDQGGPYVLQLGGADVTLRQIGPRTFAATVPNVRPGLHPVVLRGTRGAPDERLDLLVPAAAESGRELRRVAADVPLLRAVAEATGGAVDPDSVRVLSARPGVRHQTVPLDGLLVPLALALMLADVAVRRLILL